MGLGCRHRGRVRATPGQSVRFYEINQEVKYMAEKYFSFLSGCLGKSEIVLGDARLSLEREPAQHFHVLVLDAFSGDAVPAHLLTKEAFAVYLRHLRPDGVIAINITNRHSESVSGGSRAWPTGLSNAKRCAMFSEPNQAPLVLSGGLAACSRETPPFVAAIAERAAASKRAREVDVAPLLWTDHYSNLFQILE